MDRRTFIKAGAVLPATAAISGLPKSAFADTKDGDPWRIFEVTSQVEVLQPAGATRVWLPVPLTRDTDYFKSLGNSWTATGGRAAFVEDKKYGAGILSAEFTGSSPKPMLQLVSRFATRDRAVDLSKPARGVKEDRAILKLNLESTELIPTDGIVRDTARDVTKWQWNNIDKARAIYEWVVENTFRDPKVRGCGWGDIKAMLETRNMGGKCGDLNALFVGLARAAGVPARDVYGVRVAKSNNGYVSLGANTDVISKAQHCRAEFYAEGYGWIPVDPADVRKVALEEPPGNLALTNEKVRKARERLFGYWEMNWLAYNYAHDLQLPGSKGPKIPYLMYPTGETAKGRLDPLEPDSFKYVLTARELKSA
jgi:transglutaminase-like putative cysteine protease